MLNLIYFHAKKSIVIVYRLKIQHHFFWLNPMYEGWYK